MPLRILRSRNVAGANVIQIVGAAGMFGMFFLGALYLQQVLHYDALQIGLAFLPVTIIMGTLSVRYSERLITPLRRADGMRARPGADHGRPAALQPRPGGRPLRA